MYDVAGLCAVEPLGLGYELSATAALWSVLSPACEPRCEITVCDGQRVGLAVVCLSGCYSCLVAVRRPPVCSLSGCLSARCPAHVGGLFGRCLLTSVGRAEAACADVHVAVCYAAVSPACVYIP